MKLKVGIIGAGLIGQKRAKIFKEYKKDELVGIADIDYKKSQQVAQIFDCQVFSVEDLIKTKKVNSLIIAVPNKFAIPLVIKGLKQKKYILCEKPFGKNTKESENAIKCAQEYRSLIKVGFNHRFHSAVMKAKEIIEKGGIGKILFIRSYYGHGGRLGMEKEWRLNKDISGGGELLDQGVHIIDLARFFAGEFKKVFGLVETKFWKTKVEDNTFVLMKSGKVSVQFQTSWTNWENIFSFEIFGDKGYLSIKGLGGNYGKEELIWGKRREKFGKPIIKRYTFSGKDKSWLREWENFSQHIKKGEKISGDMFDGLKANQIIEAIYDSSRKGKIIRL